MERRVAWADLQADVSRVILALDSGGAWFPDSMTLESDFVFVKSFIHAAPRNVYSFQALQSSGGVGRIGGCGNSLMGIVTISARDMARHRGRILARIVGPVSGQDWVRAGF